MRPPLEFWLNQHVEYGQKLAELVIQQAQARARALQKVEKRKSSGVAVLPGKLTDCESTELARNELFLVEGDSAGGSAKMGRDKEYQAILPLRGKVLNTWEVERDRLFAQQRGPRHRGGDRRRSARPGRRPSISPGLRYGKICILSDADVDGSHIQVLLLTLFFRHFPQPDRARPRVRRAAAAVPRRRARARQEAGAAKLYASTTANSRRRSTSCARKACATTPWRSAASRAWAR